MRAAALHCAPMALDEDRDYMNRPLPRTAYRGPRLRSVTLWLIVINVAVFLLDRLLLRMGIGYVMHLQGLPDIVFSPLEYWGHFSHWKAIEDIQPWRFITFQFLHGNFDHLVFNMLALYFFGPLVEAFLRPRQFLVFYLLCGIGGAAMYELLLLGDMQIADPWVPLVGASAGIFGVLIASAMIAPHAMVFLFGIVPMRLATLAYLFIGYAVLNVVFRASNAGGEAAHLGGAAVGWLLMSKPQILERIGWGGGRAPPF
jgi:membrane associated rhomboid family serine protease